MDSTPPSSNNGSAPPDRDGEAVAEGQSEERPKPTTLSPPEWEHLQGPRSAASVALDRYDVDGPIPRRTGARAERASLRARLKKCSERRDADGESVAASQLSRSLAARGAELDTATKVARRSLLLRDDPELREELSGWFAGLGEPALAASTLRPLAAARIGPAAANTLTRIAVLLARSGDAAGAADALAEAAREAPSDPVAPELLGALGAWAPDSVSPERASDGYLEGASRREAQGERPAAFEDLLRAFEMAPSSAVAVERLCAVLASRGRLGAADEVRRQQARARGEAGREVHLRRMRDLAAGDDLPRAIGAALDARLDETLDLTSVQRAVGLLSEVGDHPVGFDELLHRAGLHELVAARIELLCESVETQHRAGCLLALGRVCSGPLASPERAVDAWIDALAVDPSCEEAKASLRGHAASTHDQAPLVEALIRIALGGTAESAAVPVAGLRELVVLAEQRLADPGLALWAVQRLESAGASDPELQQTRQRLAPRARLQEEELASVRAALQTATGPDRGRLLRRAAGILFGRPDEAEAYLGVLAELSRLFPEERGWRIALERVCWRTGRTEQLSELLRETVARSSTPPEAARAALTLAAIRRRQGDLKGALQELVSVPRQSGAQRAVSSMALLLSAKLGDETGRARALISLAAPLPPALRAVLGSVAAESLLAAGDIEAAEAAARQATHADPSLARPLAALAAVQLQAEDRADVGAIERAMGVVVPRAAMCEALADAYDDADELVLAVAWTQRWLALRPGDPRAAEAMLRRVTLTGDAVRLADALAWLLSQPQPLTPLAETVSAALSRLARVAPPRGAALARRTLDVVGPRATELRDAVLEVADVVGERGLAIAVVERWLAAGAPGADRTDLLLDVARRRKAAGDADGAARALARAMAEGADPTAVLAELDVAVPARSSDGEIALLEARAEALSGLSGADFRGTALAWREYGAACWDLATDPDGAMRAWERAAALDPERGLARLAGDLVAFGGPEDALCRLEELASRRRDLSERVRVLAIAANVALQAGERDHALRLAGDALKLDPSQSELLAIAERAADQDRVPELVRIYDLLADAALGCYGERAVRYRAARRLEQRNAHAEAFRNAVAAFEAVPGAGVAFILAARLGDRSNRSMELVQAIERVASRCASDDERAVWLERAAKLAGTDEDGKRERVEVLLRALTVRPDVHMLHSLGEALGDLVKLNPEDTEIVELRFERAISGMLSRLDGPDGARAAVEAAHVALSTFDSAPLATSALERAVRCCAEIEEYERLWELTSRLANAPERARAVLALMQDLSKEKYAAVSRQMVELGVRLADEFDDARSAASLLVHAALREPDDAQLAQQAAAMANESGDPNLLALIVDVVPSAHRTSSLLAMASAAEQAEDSKAAVEALEQLLQTEDVEEGVRRDSVERLRELYASTQRWDALTELLIGELERGGLDVEARVRIVRELGAAARAGASPTRAVGFVAGLVEERPDDEELMGDIAALARQGGEKRALANTLGRLVDLTGEPGHKHELLRELAPLLEELHDQEAALQRWAELLPFEPHRGEALAALERDAERRGDWDAVVSFLERRAAVATEVDEVRRLRLHRAGVLEHRLGRRDDARAELEALLAATGDDLTALRMLADINQRLGDELRAGPLWLRAAGLASEGSEAAELSRRACDAYLRGGDVASARRVLEGMRGSAESEESLLRLRVEVERCSEDPLGLAAALDELAAASKDDADQRAEWLMEAVRASEAGGDAAGALSRAQRAASTAPYALVPQLSARLLEYRDRGAGTPDEAQATVQQLQSISGELSPLQAELSAFLIAEAFEVTQGADAAFRELERVHEECGPLPLVAVGMAERLARGHDLKKALSLFDAALVGDLRGVRQRGSLALQAAETAYAADEHERALGYLEVAAAEKPSRADALALAAMIRDELHAPGEGAPRSEAAADEEVVPASEEAPDTDQQARAVAPEAADVPEDQIEELDDADLELLSLGSSEVPADLVVPAEEVESVRPEPSVSPSVPPAPAPEPFAGRLESNQAHPTFPPASREEASLLDALARGSVEAGQELVAKLQTQADRSPDLLSVCRRLAVVVPGDRDILYKLHGVAVADDNLVYARAIVHAQNAFLEGLAPIPPPLMDQPEQPEHVRALLFRDAHGVAARALALVWEGAGHVFQRDPSAYRVTGLERVPLGAPTAVGQMYSAAGRVLGLTRTPVFQRRNVAEVTISVALLSEPALIINGDVQRESPELAFHLGAMLAATLPEYVLLFGSSPEEARDLLEALGLAFGRSDRRGSGVESVAKLAEVLWESIPARSQRELGELCADPARLDYDVAVAAARRAARRAGLFIAGDLAVAVRATCVELGISTQMLDGPEGLAALCSSSPDISDLVRLATSPQYAEARWQPSRAGHRPPSGTWTSV